MKRSLSIAVFLIVLGNYYSSAQNDSVYNRYTDKFRLESISIKPTYVGFGLENNKDVLSLNGTFSYNNHLFAIDYLEIVFKTEDNDEIIRNNYNVIGFSYGYATVFNKRWRMHNTLGLGRIRVRKDEDRQSLQDDSGLNFKLSSTVFFDLGKRIAIGTAFGYNLNTIESLPEIGLAFTYKFRNKSESSIIKEKRKERFRRSDSIRLKKLEKYADLDLPEKTLNRKTHRYSFSLHFTFFDNLNGVKPHIAGIQASYLFKNNGLISLGHTGLREKESNESEDRFRNRYRTLYMTYGKRLTTENYFLEFNTGLSYFEYEKERILARLLGNDFETIETETSIGLPLITRAGVYLGNHFEIGIRSDYQLNFVKPTFSTGFFLSYSF